MVDNVAALLSEDDWTATGVGRPAKDSIYLPLVQYSVDNPPAEGKAHGFTVTLKKNSSAEPEARSKDLTYHKNQLQRAGTQVKGEPVTVLVQAGNVNEKTGEVRLSFKTRAKITRKPKA